jgi:hypothetical protein
MGLISTILLFLPVNTNSQQSLACIVSHPYLADKDTTLGCEERVLM